MSNGKIALLIFGRVADVQRGVLKLAETGAETKRKGIDPFMTVPLSMPNPPPSIYTTRPRTHAGGKGHVASGVDLIFSRFHNKGVVGVALQYYGTAIAFLVAHYASDSGGRKRWERRDEVRACIVTMM